MKDKKCEHCGLKFSPPYAVTLEYWQRRRFCSAACRSAGMRGKRRSTFGKRKLTMKERFWSKVVKGKAKECWLWVGAKDTKGYGYLAGTMGEPAIKAHRLSYEIHKGPLPKGMCACHSCDNPSCVNPKHLFPGTRADNHADMVEKGRGPDKRGEKNPKAKLNFEKAEQIRKLRAEGKTQQQIADQFGVSQNAIWQILSGKRWTTRKE